MKKTALALSVGLLAACTQAPKDALFLNTDGDKVRFEQNDQGVWQADHFFKKGSYNVAISNKEKTCGFSYGLADAERIKFNKAQPLDNCVVDSKLPLRVYKPSNYLFTLDTATQELTVKVKPKKKITAAGCPVASDQPTEIDVSKTFADGTWVQDAFSEQKVQVVNGKVTLQATPNSQGLILLEKVEQPTADTFSWDNATVYFVMTDRFYNGNPNNDHSYGRHNDGKQEIGTFHGGDLAGLTQKLDYFSDLGVNAIWITSPLEQIHGWVGGGNNGDFPHYGYHGYYHQDWTKLDKNMGTEEELKTFMDSAHKKGIRVIWDVVVNHTGYATLADMQEFGFGSLYLDKEDQREILGEKWTNWTPKRAQNWHSFHDYINYSDSKGWNKWWGKDWIRTGVGNYDRPGYNDRTMSLSYLPDLKTESTKATGMPTFYANKPDTNAKDIQKTPRMHLITWLTDWVREYGIDGFRVDTAKHVELGTWVELKKEANAALAQWKKNNPDKALDSAPFWMTGEVWGHGVSQSKYFGSGFDSVINFEFQDNIAPKALTCFSNIDNAYNRYAKDINTDKNFNVLSYLSSHDTSLFWKTRSKTIADQKRAAEALLLAPGAVQIFYGDEVARDFGPTGSDTTQGTRSDMPWDQITGERSELLAHWQTLGNFRKRHPAIGQGQHITRHRDGYYAFERQLDNDKVLVIYTGE